MEVDRRYRERRENQGRIVETTKASWRDRVDKEHQIVARNEGLEKRPSAIDNAYIRMATRGGIEMGGDQLTCTG